MSPQSKSTKTERIAVQTSDPNARRWKFPNCAGRPGLNAAKLWLFLAFVLLCAVAAGKIPVVDTRRN